MTRSDLSLGFVGLGALGLPMAINLHRAGLRLRVHTRSRKAETRPELEGATRCSSPAEASAGVDVLLLCVSDDEAVEEVLFGPHGAASQLTTGSVVLDCSTIAPATAERCAERLARQNVHYLDAPVTGGTEGAKRGSLTVLVGGATEPLERVRPILEVIGSSIHHFGSVGRGQQVKAVNQVLVAGSYAAVAEAVALGQRLDLPMPMVVDALKNGAAGSWALEHRSTAMLEGSYPLGFRLSLHRKDLGIALDTARAVKLDLPVTTLVEQLELDLINGGHGDEDVSALHRWNPAMGES
ncbi:MULTISPECIES: NAD(P)-dependent oxidoreductase [unclassified Synechococcus]|uniref:NAD(P)-dependent oxidoreductase n=1 Tax=unclassified Synechococcus TaxID=2626047 RepID=UPI001CF923D2|nr:MULTISPECIES: NAD(P)-dependent oxidoreductase [unclassified Synechococcus]MCB4376662.1 NAD(P)-dependent oxidoreductase [Synechococcus sp. MU1650]MCB4411227.1 NAD(P)-dependent oxidoreductase [Synechococcus sp. MU1611]